MPASFAAVTCSAPKRAFDEVSEPVTATPSQPISGDRKAKKSPAPAAPEPERDRLARLVHHVGQRQHRHTVRIAHLSWTMTRRQDLERPAGETPARAL